MRAMKFIFAGLMVMALQNNGFADYDQASALAEEVESTLADLTSAMEQGDDAQAKALATSYGQKFMALDQLSADLAEEDPVRFAVLEDKIRLAIHRHLSALAAVRKYVPSADRTGIDRSFQVYLNARERAAEVVAYTLLKENTPA